MTARGVCMRRLFVAGGTVAGVVAAFVLVPSHPGHAAESICGSNGDYCSWQWEWFTTDGDDGGGFVSFANNTPFTAFSSWADSVSEYVQLPDSAVFG
jgi:hypothetical protein